MCSSSLILIQPGDVQVGGLHIIVDTHNCAYVHVYINARTICSPGRMPGRESRGHLQSAGIGEAERNRSGGLHDGRAAANRGTPD